MGGKLWAESEPGKGSTFRFTAELGAAPQAAPPPPLAVEDLTGVRVLVADAEPASRSFLKDTLASLNTRPMSVESGQRAMEEMRHAKTEGKPFGLALLEASLPDMSGFSLAERIREDPNLAQTTLIMMSHAGLRGDAAACEALSVAAYLTKPISPGLLRKAMQAALGAHRQGATRHVITRHALREDARFCLLLVEDNPVNQAHALAVLRKYGHDVVLVDTGLKAVEAAERTRFDAILMDLQLPEMSGLEAAAAIRRREKSAGAHVPIIAMTACVMDEDRQRCAEAGMDGFITKPIIAEHLARMVAELAEKGRDRQGRTAGAGEGEQAPQRLLDLGKAVQHVGGAEAAARKVLEAFRCSTPALLSDLRWALETCNTIDLLRLLHQLKGSLGLVACDDLCQDAAVIEAMVKNGHYAEARQTFHRFEPALAALLTELSEAVKGPIPCKC
jgi:CheY-like chemotaxis protein/HPt (histidine-containing phosphotransfer) domain-containing protein